MNLLRLLNVKNNNMIELLTPLLHGSIFGAFAFLVNGPLMLSGEIFGRYRPFLERIFKTDNLERLSGWKYCLYKITGGCAKCFAGFWSMVIILIDLYFWYKINSVYAGLAILLHYEIWPLFTFWTSSVFVAWWLAFKYE